MVAKTQCLGDDGNEPHSSYDHFQSLGLFLEARSDKGAGVQSLVMQHSPKYKELPLTHPILTVSTGKHMVRHEAL